MTTTQITVKPNSSAASALRPLVFDLRVPLGSGPGARGGHGLRGLAERATAVGGTLESGPCADGGYRLAVRVPAGTREEVTA